MPYNDTEVFQSGNYCGWCSDGIFVPAPVECNQLYELTVFFYLMGLLCCFVGVTVIADIFMGSIEKITSKTRKIYLRWDNNDQPKLVEVRIWSETVANLTLIALGSSAPQILLPLIEMMGYNFSAGDLGPATIVGSAAFNMFVIIGMSIMAVPNGETRRIKDIKLFSVTVGFSILAYLWLLIILFVTSLGVVNVWEAAVTLFFFPPLVIVSWLVGKNEEKRKEHIELGNIQQADKMSQKREFLRDCRLDRAEFAEFLKEVKKYPELTDEDAATLAATKLVESQSHSRMWYRVGAVRSITGGRRIVPHMSMKLKQVYKDMNKISDAPTLEAVPKVVPSQNAIIDFHSASCAVMENIGKFPVQICRTGRLDNRVRVRVETKEQNAVVEKGNININEVVTFDAGETEKEVMVEIVKDNQWKPGEEFFLKISLINDEDQHGIQLGRVSIIKITVLIKNESGTVMFQERDLVVKQTVCDAIITVIRKNGADGEISVKWRTIDKSAINGKDFEGGEGVLVFKHTEAERNIVISLINGVDLEKEQNFEIELYEVEGGATIGQINRTTVTIINDGKFDGALSNVMLMTNDKLQALKVYYETYIEQIVAALKVNGGDTENATKTDYVLHFLSFGWKILFSLVPPASILEGWLCFFISLACIGILTALIGDLAAIFGCLVGLESSITAMTLIVLGTSLPDILASKKAVAQEKYADSVIVTVTGSNSFNVFLGLGLPWLIAAIYHSLNANVFMVYSTVLVFNFGIFMGLCAICIPFLVMRRLLPIFGKAELGGPSGMKFISGIFLCVLWILYVSLYILKAYYFL